MEKRVALVALVEIVQKILNCGDNPYTCLDLNAYSTLKEIDSRCRKLSLLVHPDKNKAPRSKDATERLFELCDKARFLNSL
jgi:DnaJ-class molecular chaperone